MGGREDADRDHDIGGCWSPGTRWLQWNLGVRLDLGRLLGSGRGCHQNEPEMTFTPTLGNVLDVKQDKTKRKHIQREPIWPNEVPAPPSPLPRPCSLCTICLQLPFLGYLSQHAWLGTASFNPAFPDGSFWPKLVRQADFDWRLGEVTFNFGSDCSQSEASRFCVGPTWSPGV